MCVLLMPAIIQAKCKWDAKVDMAIGSGRQSTDRGTLYCLTHSALPLTPSSSSTTLVQTTEEGKLHTENRGDFVVKIDSF